VLTEVGVEGVAMLCRGGRMVGVWKGQEVEAVTHSNFACWNDGGTFSQYSFSLIPTSTIAQRLMVRYTLAEYLPQCSSPAEYDLVPVTCQLAAPTPLLLLPSPAHHP
jgi:hypothetical protein